MGGDRLNIQLNGKLVEVPSPLTIHQILEQFLIPVEATAIAVNNEVMPMSEWATTPVKDNDCIEVIRAVGRG